MNAHFFSLGAMNLGFGMRTMGGDGRPCMCIFFSYPIQACSVPFSPRFFWAVGPSQSNNFLLLPFHPLFNNTKKIKQSMNLIDEMEARNEKAGNII